MTATPTPGTSSSENSYPAEAPGSDQQSWQPARPVTPSEAPYRQLRRSSSNKVLGGVCGGLAEYTGTDPLLWRIGFIALAAMGAGLVVYLLLWLVLPGDDASGSAVAGLHETLRNGRAPRA